MDALDAGSPDHAEHANDTAVGGLAVAQETAPADTPTTAPTDSGPTAASDEVVTGSTSAAMSRMMLTASLKVTPSSVQPRVSDKCCPSAPLPQPRSSTVAWLCTRLANTDNEVRSPGVMLRR